MEKNRLVLLCGPSGVGKSPLHKALKRFYPRLEERLGKLVLFTSRPPRPGEEEGVDYYFRTREEIETFRTRPGFLVLDVRGDLQALEIDQIDNILNNGRSPFFEGNPFVGAKLITSPALHELPKLAVFLSPLSQEEIVFLKAQDISLPEFVAEVMRRKLLRRTKAQKGILSRADLETVERRARSAYAELQLAWMFDYVIPNHDGEDSDSWEQFYFPLGDARRALLLFSALLSGEEPPGVEKWEQHLVP